MSSKDNIVRKLYRKIVPNRLRKLIRKIFYPCQEMPKHIKFLICLKKRRDLLNKVNKCSNLHNLFKYTEDIFGLIQIKEEILGFLEFGIKGKPKIVCEIGAGGSGTSFLLSKMPSVSLVICLDLYIHNRFILRYFSPPDKEIKFIDGSSHDDYVIDRVKSILNGRKINLLFIDGDHSYDGVRQDFLKYRQFVADNGIIAFHDIIPDYKARFGVQTNTDGGEVYLFYKEIKSLYNSAEFIKNTDQDGFGIGAIRFSEDVDVKI